METLQSTGFPRLHTKLNNYNKKTIVARGNSLCTIVFFFFFFENLIYIYRWISNLILRSVNPGSYFKISAPDKYFIAIDFHIEALAARLMLIFVCPKVGDGSSIKLELHHTNLVILAIQHGVRSLLASKMVTKLEGLVHTVQYYDWLQQFVDELGEENYFADKRRS